MGGEGSYHHVLLVLSSLAAEREGGKKEGGKGEGKEGKNFSALVPPLNLPGPF